MTYANKSEIFLENLEIPERCAGLEGKLEADLATKMSSKCTMIMAQKNVGAGYYPTIIDVAGGEKQFGTLFA